MNWMIPGTVLPGCTEEAGSVPAQFQSLFLAGDMVLGQVSHLSGLPVYMIQNWVKRGFLSPPKAKRYSLNQLCRILNINMLKGALSMDQICGLLTYINGRLDDESDDLIDDAQLYFLFVQLAARVGSSMDEALKENEIDSILLGFPEKVPHSRERIAAVLHVMLNAWNATNYKNLAEAQIAELGSDVESAIS